MNFEEIYLNKNEKPLERLVEGYSHTSVFRKIAFIGDSLSSGEFETCDKEGNKGYHDLYEYSWGQYIARKNGLTAFTFSRGGMTASEYIESFGEANDFFNKDKACQAYVIALGANDVNSGIKRQSSSAAAAASRSSRRWATESAARRDKADTSASSMPISARIRSARPSASSEGMRYPVSPSRINAVPP